MSGDATPARALRIARSWLGTPYRHQGVRRGVGCDCLGLLRGVWRELYGQESEAPGPYPPEWAEAGGADRLREAAERHLLPLSAGEARPGDVALLAWRAGAPARHCGILDEAGRLIHAYEGASVVSSAMPVAWTRRIAGHFRFPPA